MMGFIRPAYVEVSHTLSLVWPTSLTSLRIYPFDDFNQFWNMSVKVNQCKLHTDLFVAFFPPTILFNLNVKPRMSNDTTIILFLFIYELIFINFICFCE